MVVGDRVRVNLEPGTVEAVDYNDRTAIVRFDYGRAANKTWEAIYVVPVEKIKFTIGGHAL